MKLFRPFAVLAACLVLPAFAPAAPLSSDVAGTSGTSDLVIAAAGKSDVTVAVAADAGEWEAKAAADLVTYIEKMSGAKPMLANTADAIAAAMKGQPPVIVVGRLAVETEPSLAAALSKVAKPNPLLRADAIVLKRSGHRVYVAGTNDDSHYYAASVLLGRWGCRWYLPGEIGECIPQHPTLKVGDLDYAYAPPFEVRKYWLSWIGDTTGKPQFSKRNFFNEVGVPSGHSIGKYTKALIPPGKSMFNVPISEDRTADTVAEQVLPLYAAGKDFSLGMEDGLYESDSPQDKELIALQYDKYFLTQSYTDAFMVFYNKTAERLMKQAPQSKSKIGFLIYSNITLPPVRDITAAKPLVGYLAPIDIDPIHGMDDPRSGPRREYKDMLYKWAKVMQGRLAIYDYDQSMLVWRDIPNPSHQAFRQDVKHYRKAGALGVDTESRGAMATTFLNLFFRGQLQWDPDADVDALLAEFYPKFYGPAAGPMKEYWTAIYKAWEDTIATEHEYFVAPAVYTPELMVKLREHVKAAEAAMAAAEKDAERKRLTPQGRQQLDRYAARMKIARVSFDILDHYITMVQAATTDIDYKAAVAAGEKGLAAREELTTLDPTFTTYKKIGERGYSWWPGEVKQYQELIPFTDGTQGTLIAKLPLVWNFRRDPKDVGEKEGWAKQPVDLSWWNSLKQPVSVEDRQKNPAHWEQLRSDLYIQAQGIITPDFQSYTGHAWYQVDVDLDAAAVKGNVHLRFPGLFNECWLYVNGEQVAHRPFKGMWWRNDYRFEWDVNLTGKLKAGKNSLALRIHNPHHFGGMFRRPFLYRANLKAEAFDRDPNWEGHNNRIVPKKGSPVKQDFGYSATNFAGKGKGEVGGKIQRSTTPASYAAKITPKNLNTKLSTSGSFALTASQPGAGVFFGFFNSQQPGGSGRPIGSLGLDFDFEGSGGRLAVRLITNANKSCGTFITPYLPGKYRPTPIRNDGTRYHWTLDYDPKAADGNGQFTFTMRSDNHPAGEIDPALPEASKQEARIRFPHTTKFVVDLTPGFKQENATFDRFGIQNMMKAGGTATMFFDDVKINGKPEDFTQDPSWVSAGNRVEFEDRELTGAHDFGFSAETKNAGGTPGEIGGGLWRSGDFAWYADRIGSLNLEQRLEAHGKAKLVTAGPDSDMFIGWFNSAAKGKNAGDEADFVGVHVGGPTRIGHYFSPRFASAKGSIGKLDKAPVLPVAKVVTWSIVYDPAANGGNGEVRASLGQESVTLPLKPGQKVQGATLDRFGLFTSTAGGQMVKIYLDDVKYTAEKP